jgi:hypothetical protein
MAELPAARVRSRDRLAVAVAHLRRGARLAPRIARWLGSFVLILVAVAYALSWLASGTRWKREPHELPRVIHLGSAADELEIVERPAVTERGTVMIETLARKRRPPATAPSAPR